jgi:hypothetical protein
MTRLVYAFAGTVCGTAALVAALTAQAQAPSMPRDRALAIIRTINTAQAEVLKTEKKYVGLPQLAQQAVFALPELQSVKQGTALAPDGGPIPVGSYALRVDPAADGRRYTVALVGQIRCSTSWFSNESGAIFEGKPIGCDQP